MDIVVRANKEAFYEEENTMCEALEQIASVVEESVETVEGWLTKAQ